MNPVALFTLGWMAGFLLGVAVTWWAAMRSLRGQCRGFVWNGLCTRPFKHKGRCRAA